MGMDEFSYLSVLLSIIIGLAVTQLLTGMRGQMLARTRVRGFWPSQLWAGSFLVISTQVWWAMFDLRDRHDWAFAGFAIILAQTIALYLLTGLIYPDFPGEGTIDLRAHYFAQRIHFFTLLAIAPVLSVARDLVLNHALPERENLAFHGLFLALAVSGFIAAREAWHKVLAAFAAAAIVCYVVFLFAHLGGKG